MIHTITIVTCSNVELSYCNMKSSYASFFMDFLLLSLFRFVRRELYMLQQLILTLAQLILTKQKLDLADFHLIIDLDESITLLN